VTALDVRAVESASTVGDRPNIKEFTAIDMRPGIEGRQAQDLPEEDATAPDVEMAALLDVAERRPGLRQSVSLRAKCILE
jgi:hypothetical protein